MVADERSDTPPGWWASMDAMFSDSWGPVTGGLGAASSDPGLPTIELVWHARGDQFMWLRTKGMSALPMSTPLDAGVPNRAELVTAIPDGWNFLSDDGTVDEATWWFGSTLLRLALFPHLQRTWYSMGHTLPLSNDERTPIHPSTLFTSVVFHFTIPPPELRFAVDDTACMFLVPVFLTDAELHRVRREGVEALSSFGPSFSYWFQPSRSCSVTGRSVGQA